MTLNKKMAATTTHLLEMMFSPLFGKEDVFDLKLQEKGISSSPLSLDLLMIQHEIEIQDDITAEKSEHNEKSKFERSKFLLDSAFPQPYLTLLKENLSALNRVITKNKILPEEIPFIPSSSYDINNIRQSIATAFELHLEYFFSQISKGIALFLPNHINYEKDYDYTAYSTLGELQRGVEKFATAIHRRRNLESLQSFSMLKLQNKDLVDNINLALYTRPNYTRQNERLKNNPIDVIILRIKDFYESLPQKIARYWIDLLKGVNDTKTVSGTINRKILIESDDEALFIRSEGNLREVKLEDLLITDIFGVAIIFNDSMNVNFKKKRIEAADFYRGDMVDAREISIRNREKHGYKRRISKLINRDNGVMIDYHTIPSLDDYIIAEFSSEKAHLIYAIRRHNSYIADKKYGKLYRAIYEAVKEIICEASVPSLQPKMLDYWRKSLQKDKALASLMHDTAEFCSSFGISDAMRIMIKQEYTVLRAIKPNGELKKEVRKLYNEIPIEKKSEYHQSLRSLILNYVDLFEKTVAATSITEFIDTVSVSDNTYRIDKHPLKIVLELDFLVSIYTASQKFVGKAVNTIDHVISTYSKTVKSLSHLSERLYCIDRVAPYITFTEYADVRPFLKMIQLYLPQFTVESAKEKNKLILDKYNQTIAWILHRVDNVTQNIMDKQGSQELLISSNEFADFRKKIDVLRPLYEMHGLSDPFVKYSNFNY